MILTILLFFVLNFIYDYYNNSNKEKTQLWLFGILMLLLFAFSCKTETKQPIIPIVEEKLIQYEYTFQQHASEDGLLYANKKIESKFYISKLGSSATIMLIQNKDTIFNNIFIAGTTTYTCINTDSPIMIIKTEPQFIIIDKSGKRHLYYETN
jgi:hypothetical protein